MFSEKATKIDKIFTANLTVCSNRQIDGEDFVNFCGLLKKHELYRSLYKLKMKIENKQKFTFPSKLISTLRVMQKCDILIKVRKSRKEILVTSKIKTNFFLIFEKHTKFENFLIVLTNQLIYLVNVKTTWKIFFKLCVLLKKSEL